MAKRNYSQKTLKVLFALSGNQCAHPECSNTLVESATEQSDAITTAHICHIYAVSEAGPRGKSGLTKEELNSPENLILFCRHHHAVIDGQHETYPAELLKKWKQTHEDKMRKILSKNLEHIQSDVLSHPYFPTELVDQKIKEETDRLRQSRFFAEFNCVGSSLTLARRLVKGDLLGGTNAVRCESLGWCVRFLSRTEELDKAEEYLKLAKELGPCQEIGIADAFISSQKGNKKAALSTLASLDSPLSRSAAFMIVAHHDGSQEAVDWLKSADIDASGLDPEGRRFLLGCQLELANWEAAQDCLDLLTDDDLHDVPVLHHMAAITHLLKAVPNELRAAVLNQPPFDARNFPLASDAVALEARRVARAHFVDASKIVRELNLDRAATIADEYALWLELRDLDESEGAKIRLASKLRDSKSALRLVHLGLEFGIKLDLPAVEREIERQVILKGGITYDTALARFSLLLTQNTPEDIANSIGRHFDELADYIDKKAMRSIQIEMFSKAGLLERAKECLEILRQEGLSEGEESRLWNIIAEAEGTDPVENRKARFEETGSLSDLASLVEELEIKRDWDGLCKYGDILFQRTGSLQDAERFSSALYNAKENERVVEFLRSKETLVAQSKHLPMIFCWSLYHEGALLEARFELAKLHNSRNDPNYRALQFSLGVSLGDWDSLSVFVDNEYLERDKRDARDLLKTAHVALRLGLPRAKELIFAAANKGNDDAGILGAAYFLATNAGWEDKKEVSQWIHRAAELSGNEGPIQTMTLKDVLDLKPEWDRREFKIWQLLSRGEIPMFLAAQSLNKSLISLMLFPALANLSESDPRRRGAVPAYSGQRQSPSLNAGGQIGIDATVLITLSFLNLLDESLDAFDTVHVPHSTLAWLFEEKQKAAFHQPSQIRDAQQIRDLLATDVLRRLEPSSMPDSDLSDQVGEELALLITEAEKVRLEDDLQRVVVRPSPVHQVASLMEEEADLAAHAAVLSSCQAIVDKLRQKGQITAEEESRTRSYLQLNEKPWPNQPEIADGAILYIDGLAIKYFLHLGILGKLHGAGFRPIVSPNTVSETDKLISYGSIAGKVEEIIEQIRSAINSRIESGKIKVGRRTHINQPTERPMPEHPTMDLIALVKHCDAIITDDRFLNQHPHFDDNGALAPIFSTLDLIDALVSIGSITPENQLEYRTRLRQAGYFFVPVSDDELVDHLNVSIVEEGKIIETAELKAIRENILHVRMRAWLQIPKEAPWLDTIRKVFIRVLKGLWKADTDFSSSRVRSDWIMDQIDLRGWTHSFSCENGTDIVKNVHAEQILMILMPLVGVSQEVKNQYWNWVEDRVLRPAKEQFPDLYSCIVERQRRVIASVADMDPAEGRET